MNRKSFSGKVAAEDVRHLRVVRLALVVVLALGLGIVVFRREVAITPLDVFVDGCLVCFGEAKRTSFSTVSSSQAGMRCTVDRKESVSVIPLDNTFSSGDRRVGLGGRTIVRSVNGRVRAHFDPVFAEYEDRLTEALREGERVTASHQVNGGLELVKFEIVHKDGVLELLKLRRPRITVLSATFNEASRKWIMWGIK